MSEQKTTPELVESLQESIESLRDEYTDVVNQYEFETKAAPSEPFKSLLKNAPFLVETTTSNVFQQFIFFIIAITIHTRLVIKLPSTVAFQQQQTRRYAELFGWPPGVDGGAKYWPFVVNNFPKAPKNGTPPINYIDFLQRFIEALDENDFQQKSNAAFLILEFISVMNGKQMYHFYEVSNQSGIVSKYPKYVSSLVLTSSTKNDYLLSNDHLALLLKGSEDSYHYGEFQTAIQGTMLNDADEHAKILESGENVLAVVFLNDPSVARSMVRGYFQSLLGQIDRLSGGEFKVYSLTMEPTGYTQSLEKKDSKWNGAEDLKFEENGRHQMVFNNKATLDVFVISDRDSTTPNGKFFAQLQRYFLYDASSQQGVQVKPFPLCLPQQCPPESKKPCLDKRKPPGDLPNIEKFRLIYDDRKTIFVYTIINPDLVENQEYVDLRTINKAIDGFEFTPKMSASVSVEPLLPMIRGRILGGLSLSALAESTVKRLEPLSMNMSNDDRKEIIERQIVVLKYQKDEETLVMALKAVKPILKDMNRYSTIGMLEFADQLDKSGKVTRSCSVNPEESPFANYKKRPPLLPHLLQVRPVSAAETEVEEIEEEEPKGEERLEKLLTNIPTIFANGPST